MTNDTKPGPEPPADKQSKPPAPSSDNLEIKGWHAAVIVGVIILGVIVYGASQALSDGQPSAPGHRVGGPPTTPLPAIKVYGGERIATLSKWQQDGSASHLKAKLCSKPGATVTKVTYVAYAGTTKVKEEPMDYPAHQSGTCAKATLWWPSTDNVTKVDVLIEGKLPRRTGVAPESCMNIARCCGLTGRRFVAIKSRVTPACRANLMLLCVNDWVVRNIPAKDCSKYLTGFSKDCGEYIPQTAHPCFNRKAPSLPAATGGTPPTATSPQPAPGDSDEPEGALATGRFTIADLTDLNVVASHISEQAKKLVKSGSNRRKVAAALNKRGMIAYKDKAWKEALAAFKIAYDIDAGFDLPIYNAACVCGIMTKPEEALRWLYRLKKTGTARSKRLLKKALRDKDFDKIREHPEFRTFAQRIQGR